MFVGAATVVSHTCSSSSRAVKKPSALPFVETSKFRNLRPISTVGGKVPHKSERYDREIKKCVVGGGGACNGVLGDGDGIIFYNSMFKSQ